MLDGVCSDHLELVDYAALDLEHNAAATVPRFSKGSGPRSAATDAAIARQAALRASFAGARSSAAIACRSLSSFSIAVRAFSRPWAMFFPPNR